MGIVLMLVWWALLWGVGRCIYERRIHRKDPMNLRGRRYGLFFMLTVQPLDKWQFNRYLKLHAYAKGLIQSGNPHDVQRGKELKGEMDAYFLARGIPASMLA